MEIAEILVSSELLMSEAKLLEIRNATVWRGSTCVFKNLNLDIEQHERVAILGPNGSGKTTLLKTINRELYPAAQDGSWIRILGKERWNVWELRRHIGVVSNDLQQLYTPTITAIEVVLSGFHSSIGVHGTLAERVTREQVDAARRTNSGPRLRGQLRLPRSHSKTGASRPQHRYGHAPPERNPARG